MIPELSHKYGQVKYVVQDWMTEFHKELTAGETRFGDLRIKVYNATLDAEIKRLWKQGSVCVNDAVLPVSFVIENNDENVNPIDEENVPDPKRTWHTEYDAWVEEQEKKAQELDDKLRKKGFVAGRLFHTPMGDGYASYVVTKVNKKTCFVEWRGFSPDKWEDRFLGHGGKFDRSQIERFVPMGEPLFGRL